MRITILLLFVSLICHAQYSDVANRLYVAKLDSLTLLEKKLETQINRINNEGLTVKLVYGASLFREGSRSSKKIAKISSGDEIHLFRFIENRHESQKYAFVEFQGKKGFIFESFIKDSPDISSFTKLQNELASIKRELSFHVNNEGTFKSSIDRKAESTNAKKLDIEYESTPLWISSLTANVRDTSSTGGKIVSTLRQGEIVYKNLEAGSWIKIRIKNNNTTPSTLKQLKQKYTDAWISKDLVSYREVALISESDLRRQKFVRDNPKLSRSRKNQILNGEIYIGMSREMVRASWGDPRDINRSVGSWGVHEQWVYYRTYVYFENGVLTAWQD